MTITKKTYLLAALSIWGVFSTTEGRAEPSLSSSTFLGIAKPQFYGGLTLGVQRLSGRRSEVVNYGASAGNLYGPPAIIYLSNFNPFANKNGFYSAHMGGTWNIPKTSFFWGTEIYIGQGGGRKNFINSFTDVDERGGPQVLDSLAAELSYSHVMLRC